MKRKAKHIPSQELDRLLGSNYDDIGSSYDDITMLVLTTFVIFIIATIMSIVNSSAGVP
jgi:hypothetical protein